MNQAKCVKVPLKTMMHSSPQTIYAQHVAFDIQLKVVRSVVRAPKKTK